MVKLTFLAPKGYDLPPEMPVAYKDKRDGEVGGFRNRISCGLFIRDYLIQEGEAVLTDIFQAYKTLLREDFLIKLHERKDYSEEKINKLAETKYKSAKRFGPTYQSFANYFNTLKRLGWVEATGETEESLVQMRKTDSESKAPGEPQPRKWFRLTPKGMTAPQEAWQDPMKTSRGV